MSTETLILASRSPRRAQLLRQAGYHFVQLTPRFDDTGHLRTQAAASLPSLVVELARLKAHSLISDSQLDLRPNSVVLAADTVVIGPDGTPMGQPGTRLEARRMLQMLINATHRVLTGVTIVDSTGAEMIHPLTDCAWVRLGGLTAGQLTEYLQSGQWRGKAGGYNLLQLQDRWPFSVDGDPATVAGLPMKRLATHLGRWCPSPPEPRWATHDA